MIFGSLAALNVMVSLASWCRVGSLGVCSGGVCDVPSTFEDSFPGEGEAALAVCKGVVERVCDNGLGSLGCCVAFVRLVEGVLVTSVSL